MTAVLLGIYIGGAIIMATTCVFERHLWPGLVWAVAWPVVVPGALVIHKVRFGHIDPTKI